MPVDCEAADLHSTFSRKQAIEVHDESGFAAAIGPQQGDGLSGRKLKVDAIKRRRAIVVAEAQAAHIDQGLHQRNLSAAIRRIASVTAAHDRNTASEERKRRVPSVRKRPGKL